MLEWPATSAQNPTPFSRGSERSWAMKRTGIFDCKIWERHIIMITLHWAPALSPLLECEQCNGNNHATHTILVMVQNLPWFLLLQTPT